MLELQQSKLNPFEFYIHIFAAIMVHAALLPKSSGSMPVGPGTGPYGKTLPENTRGPSNSRRLPPLNAAALATAAGFRP